MNKTAAKEVKEVSNAFGIEHITLKSVNSKIKKDIEKHIDHKRNH